MKIFFLTNLKIEILMKIAVLADIHGNHTALEAVIKELRVLRVDHLFILGDNIGYYYHPGKVIQYLEDWSKDMILGNHELLLKNLLDNNDISAKLLEKYGHGFEIATHRLDKRLIQELVNLEEKKLIIKDNVRFELCHGSPWKLSQYIYPDSEIEVLKKCANKNADFVFMGHTHHHFIFEYNNTIVANVGSIGQNRERGGIASWALVNTKNRTLIFKQTRYKTDELIKEVKKIDKNIPYLWEVLMR